MNIEFPKSIEEVLEEALSLQKSGAHTGDILALFPEHALELAPMLETAQALHAARDAFAPSRESFQLIFEHASLLDATQNVPAASSNTKTSQPVVLANIQRVFSWKLFVPLMAVFVIALVTWARVRTPSALVAAPQLADSASVPTPITPTVSEPVPSAKTSETPTPQPMPVPRTKASIAATPNAAPASLAVSMTAYDVMVDPAVDAIIQAATADGSVLNDENSDAALIAADSSDVQHVSQSYDASKL